MLRSGTFGWWVVLWLAGVGSPAGASRHNLLLITIDTLRADHVGANRAAGAHTPNLDRLARQGVNFEQARSPVPLTLPAHASILTGKEPPAHGVRSNGEYRLPESQDTLAEVLLANGFHTAAFVSSFVLDRRFGLAQGFQTYDDHVWSTIEELETLDSERTAEETAATFARWLDRDVDVSPFFVWVHLYDPHAPYQPPEPFRSEYPTDPYTGEVAYADSVVGAVLADLASRGRLDDTLVAIAGDHGEGLGDHGERTHSLLIFNSTLHVPMMLWGPGSIPAGRSIAEPVRLIDLAPTLLEYLGIAQSLGDGMSLRDRIENRPAASSAVSLSVYSESLYPELALGWSPLRGLENGVYRLILAPEPLLFDLAEDPRELHNLVGAEPGVYQRLKRELAARVEAMGATPTAESPVESDAETRERLASLGYVAAGGSRAKRRAPIDPNQNIELWNRIQQGIAEMGGSDLRVAVATFESALSVDPDMPLVYEYLGQCWQRLGEVGEAESVYRRALARGVESAPLHHALGRVLTVRGEIRGAEREFQIALAIDPRSVAGHYDLGNLYRSSGRHAEAVEQYRLALAINPSYVWGWNGLAISLSSMGDTAEAVEAFRRVVEIDPDGARGHFNLALALEQQGRVDEAVDHFRRFLEVEAGTASAAQRRQAEEAIARWMQ